MPKEWLHALSPAQFESQMDFLLKNNFQSLSLEEYADIANGNKTPTGRSVLITFDDGFNDNYTIAWPIAKKYGMKLNFFITTRYIGCNTPISLYKNSEFVDYHINKYCDLWRQLTWDELHDLKNQGANIELHGHNHLCYNKCKPSDVNEDIITSINVFKKNMMHQPQFFAIPYGNIFSYNNYIIDSLKQNNIKIIFSTVIGRTRLPSNKLPFHRLVLTPYDNLSIFEANLYGAYDYIGMLKFFYEYLICDFIKLVTVQPFSR
jgi:peptidoglycan/xylan/chitin deacetylase (PgdA/CDA1 family)